MSGMRNSLIIVSLFCVTLVTMLLEMKNYSTGSHSPAPVVRTKFIGAVRKDRLPLTEAMEDKVNCPGEWEWMFNSVENLILVHYWDVDQQIGRKYVLRNAYQRISRKPKVGSIPVFDDYCSLFSKCDKFNSNLAECTRCHKHRGRNRMGDIGQQHNVKCVAECV